MASKLRTSLVFAAALALLAGCAPEKPSEKWLRGEADRGQRVEASAEIEKEPVAVVGGEEISLAEFNRRVQQLPEFARARFATIEKKQEYLNSIVQFEVMADVAEEEGFGTHPAALDAMKTALSEQVLDKIVRERLSMDDIDEEAIAAYYEAHTDEYRTPAARRVAVIEADTAEQAQEVRERILAARSEDDDPVIAFRRSAAFWSIDRAVAREGGDVGWVAAPGTESERPALAKQVYALGEKGEVTQPVEFDAGWALATFFDEREEKVVSLEEASGEIRNKLYEKRRQEIVAEIVAELRQDADIERHTQVAERAKAPPAPTLRRPEDIPLHAEPGFGATKKARTDKK